MPSVMMFDTKTKWIEVIGYVVGPVVFILFVVGLITLIYRGHWWLLGACVYFLVIWLQWGTRIKPRYMVPMAPILFMAVWAGFTAMVTWGRKSERNPADTKAGWGIAIAMLTMLMIGNAIPWAVEFKIRRFPACTAGFL